MSHDPVYTWTFKENSVLIRLFMWVYAPDPTQMSFCKLFWGIVASPVTLPVRVLVALFGVVGSALKLAGRGISWAGRHSGLPTLANKLSERRSAVRLDRQLERRAASDGYELASFWYVRAPYCAPEIPRDAFWQAALTAAKSHKHPERFLAGWEKWWSSHVAPEPVAAVVPTKPKANLPSQIAEWMATTTDRYVAFWQGFNEQHSELVHQIRWVRALIAKALVRFVLYPLMVAVPIGVLSLVGLELSGHWHGPIHVISWPLAHIRHYTVATLAHFRHWIAYAVLNSGHAVKMAAIDAGVLFLVVVGCLIGTIAMISLPIFGFAIWERNHPYDPSKKTWLEVHSAPPIQRGEGLLPMYGDGWDAFWHRCGPVLAPVGKVLIVPLKILGVLLWGLARLVAYLAVGFGKGVAAIGRSAGGGMMGAGRFMVMGHHTIKNRTCPKIEIVKDAQA